MGLTLTIPIRNRAAQSTQIRSELEYRQSQMRVQQLENQVRIEVRNAQFAVQQNVASVQSAQAAVDLARQSLDAEQKKYQLGASTTTLVLQNSTPALIGGGLVLATLGAVLYLGTPAHGSSTSPSPVPLHRRHRRHRHFRPRRSSRFRRISGGRR